MKPWLLYQLSRHLILSLKNSRRSPIGKSPKINRDTICHRGVLSRAFSPPNLGKTPSLEDHESGLMARVDSTYSAASLAPPPLFPGFPAFFSTGARNFPV